MKDRLKKELQSQGADPNKSAGNPILVVAAIIGVLVIVGGQGETTVCDPRAGALVRCVVLYTYYSYFSFATTRYYCAVVVGRDNV